MNDLELNAWIEIHIFGKSVFSEIRGEYEWFYFTDADKMTEREKERYKPRDWSEYNPKKNILVDSQPRRFTTDKSAAFEVLERCKAKTSNPENVPQFDSIMLDFEDGKHVVSVRALNTDDDDAIEARDESPTVCISKFAKLLFEGEK